MENRLHLKMHNRIVIKVGTTTLTYPNGKLNLKRIARLAWVLSDLRNQGKEVILVTSGAIAVGADRLALPDRPRDTKGKQAASAVGQAVLMQIYENFFMEYNQLVAQILLTKDVLDDAVTKENARNTFFTLLELGVIPIVNENDTVSIEELGFSENDALSAYVACLVESNMLIILSDIDGLYNCDPNKNKDAIRIPEVLAITDQLRAIAGESGSSLGTGGMASKISAASMATNADIDMVIASGAEPTVIYDILDGKNVGTLFRRRT